MSNTVLFLITVLFPSWSYADETLMKTEHRGESDQYPSFAVRYLLKVSINHDTDDFENYIIEEFKKQYKEKMHRDFNGQILFVEEQDISLALIKEV